MEKSQTDPFAFERSYWEIAQQEFKKGRAKEDERELDKFLAERRTPQETRQTCVQMQKDTSKEYHPMIGKILEKINIAITLSDVAMKGAPESVGLAWMGVRLCLNAIGDDYATFQILATASSDIVGILVACATFAKLYKSEKEIVGFEDLRKQVTNEIPRIYTEILDFSWSVKHHTGKTRGRRFLGNLARSDSARFNEKVQSIREHENNMRKYAGDASMLLSRHFQESSIRHDDIMMRDLVDIQGKVDRCNEVNGMISRDLQALIKTMSKLQDMTPREFAEKRFAENLKSLAVPTNQDQVLHDKLARRQPPGTCKWIFEKPMYKDWRTSTKKNLLWVAGGGGLGKSILMSVVIDQLRTEAPQEDGCVAHLFCDKNDEATKSKALIEKHLVSQIYESFKDQDLDVLNKANEHLSKFIPNTGSTKSSKSSKEELDFSQICIRLAAISKKKIFIAVDALDECDEARELTASLKMIAHGSSSNLKIILCSRPELGDVLDETATIEVRGNNGPDIKLSAQTRIKRFPGWSPAERELACNKVVEKAESYFKYVDLAVDFLSKPWQRPLENHLSLLPPGIDTFYETVVQKTDPAYLGLLNTCLTWTILGAGTVTVDVVIDAYTQKYAVLPDKLSEIGDKVEVDEDEEDGPTEYQDLYLRQIKFAGSTLLDVDRTSSVIKTSHNTVNDYFLSDRKSPAGFAEDNVEDCDCRNCKKLTKSDGSFRISQKIGHLLIASTILKHLMSPSFRRDHLDEFRRANQRGRYGESGSLDVFETSLATLESSENSTTELDPAETPSQTQETEKNNNLEIGEVSANGVEPNVEVDEISAEGPEDDVSIHNSDTHSLTDSDFEIDAEFPIYASNVAGEDSTPLRYEVEHCSYHLEMVEQLWTLEQRHGPEWAEFEALRDKFFQDGPNYFEAWVNVRNKDRGPLTFVDDLATLHPVHVAASCGLTSVVKGFIEKGFDTSLLTDEGYIALDYAVEYYGNNRFDEAAKENRLGLLRVLLEGGSKTNQATQRDPRPTFWKLMQQDPELEAVEMFVKHGGDLNCRDGWGNSTILHALCWYSTEEVVLRYVLEKGVDVNATDNGGETPLHGLVRRDEECVLGMTKLLCEFKADVNAEDGDSQRPLYELCYGGKIEVASVLLQHRADVKDTDNQGLTALHLACHTENLKVALLLIKHGADIKAEDHQGRTPFFYACSAQTEATALALLAEIKENHDGSLDVLSIPDQHGKSPFRKAAARGHLDLVKSLFETLNQSREALDAKDDLFGRTSLHAAARNGYPDIVEFLIAKGADLHVQDKHDQSPLQVCIRGWRERKTAQYEAVCLLLLGEGEQEAALPGLIHQVAMQGSATVLEKLMDKGADPLCQDEHGWTPLDIARHYEKAEAVAVLSSRRTVTALRPRKMNDVLPKLLRVSDDGLVATLISKDFHAASTIANHPIPLGSVHFYFEVTLETTEATPASNATETKDVTEANKANETDEVTEANDTGEVKDTNDEEEPSPEVAIGLTPVDSSRFRGWIPGRSPHSAWAYHGDVGGFFGIDLKNRGIFNRDSGAPKYGPGDTIGCGLDLEKNCMIYTKNGTLLELNMPGKRATHYAYTGVTGRLYPVVGTSVKDIAMKVNFGLDKEKPFAWEAANQERNWTVEVAKLEAQLPPKPLRRALTRATTSMLDITSSE